MMLYITDKKASEKGTFILAVSFTDDEELAVIPNSFKWSLIDGNGNYINERQDEDETPATTIYIILSNNDLQIQISETALNNVNRYVVCEWTYDSNRGTDLPGKEQICFILENLKKVV